MQYLKKLVRRPNLPLQQVVRRIYEKNLAQKLYKDDAILSVKHELKKEHFDGPLCAIRSINVCSQYKELYTSKFCIKVAFGDSCFRLVSGAIIVVQNIARCRDDQIFIIHKSFEQVESFFTYPCNSKNVEIFTMSLLGKQLLKCSLSEIKCKYVLLPYKENFVAVPMLHF